LKGACSTGFAISLSQIVEWLPIFFMIHSLGAAQQQRQDTPSLTKWIGLSTSSTLLTEVASLLGLSLSDSTALANRRPFKGSSGLLCRLQPNENIKKIAFQTEILLPVVAQELIGSEVQRLLLLQRTLADSLSWDLGLAPEGLLRLRCFSWFEQAQAIVAAFDFGNLLGIEVVSEIFGIESEPDAVALETRFEALSTVLRRSSAR
jgi:hypothetical protein